MFSSLAGAPVRGALLALAALPLLAAAGAAQETVPADTAVPVVPRGPFVGFLVEATGEFGGDVVATTLFDDGSTQETHGGQGVTAAVGLRLRPRVDSPLGLRATVGFKYVTTKATNADITFTRVPIEVVGSYNVKDDFWVGGGYVHHTAVRYRGDGIGPDADFDDAGGATVEAGWRGIALTYTAIRYTHQNNEYDGGSFGVSFTHTFGGR